MGSKEYGRTFHSGSARSHSLRTLSPGQEAKTLLLRSEGGGGGRGTLRELRSGFTEGSPRTLRRR